MPLIGPMLFIVSNRDFLIPLSSLSGVEDNDIVDISVDIAVLFSAFLIIHVPDGGQSKHVTLEP